MGQRGTKRATSANVPLLLLRSSEGKLTTSREIEPVRRSFRRRGSGTFTEVARLAHYRRGDGTPEAGEAGGRRRPAAERPRRAAPHLGLRGT